MARERDLLVAQFLEFCSSFLLISHTKRGCIVDTVGTVNPVTESSESKWRHSTISVSKFSLLYIVQPSL